jgi:hypothetical protein
VVVRLHHLIRELRGVRAHSLLKQVGRPEPDGAADAKEAQEQRGRDDCRCSAGSPEGDPSRDHEVASERHEACIVRALQPCSISGRCRKIECFRRPNWTSLLPCLTLLG